MFNRRHRAQRFQPSFLILAHRIVPSSGDTDPLVSVTPVCVETVDVSTATDPGVSITPIIVNRDYLDTVCLAVQDQTATAH